MIPAIIAGAVAAGSIASSLYNSSKDREAREDMVNRLGEMKAQSDNQYDQILRDITSYYENRGSLGEAKDVTAYKDAIAGYNPDSFVYTPSEFTYNKTRDDFLNPYMQAIVGDEVANVQHSAAGAGLGRGSGAAQAIAQAVAEKKTSSSRKPSRNTRTTAASSTRSTTTTQDRCRKPSTRSVRLPRPS